MKSNGAFRKGSNGNGGGADSVRSALKNKDLYLPVAVGLGGALAVVTGPPVVRGVSSAVESVKELKLDPSGILEKMGSNMGFGKGAGQSGSTGSGQKAGGKKRQSSSASRSSGGGSNGQKRSSARRGSSKRARSSSASGSKSKS